MTNVSAPEPPVDGVGARPAGERIVAAESGDRIFLGGSRDRVVARRSGERTGYVGDGDRDVLGVGIGAVGDLHLHVVDIVAAGVGRDLEVGRGDEGERAGRGVDGELGGVGAADDRVGQGGAGIGVGRRDRRDGGAVLRDVDRCGRAAAVRRDDRGIVVDVGDGDGDVLGVGVGCRRRPAPGRRRRCCRRHRSGSRRRAPRRRSSAPVLALMANLAASAPPTMRVGQRWRRHRRRSP